MYAGPTGALKLAKEQLESFQRREKKFFDKKTKASSFSPGDKVLVVFGTDTNQFSFIEKNLTILSTLWA